jgi:hypothetical protein
MTYTHETHGFAGIGTSMERKDYGMMPAQRRFLKRKVEYRLLSGVCGG